MPIYETISWNTCTDFFPTPIVSKTPNVESDVEEVIETVENYVDTKMSEIQLDGGAF